MADLGPLPRIHEREEIVHAADLELQGAIIDVMRKHGLTKGEQIRVVVSVLSGWLSSVAKFMIRVERHGNEDDPGGLER